MQKTILITGATDGIGLETAKVLVALGHHVLIHGRNGAKLADVATTLSGIPGGGAVESFKADLSRMDDVAALADAVAARRAPIHALINNAGVYNVRQARTDDGLDVRFAVNTIAPYLLTRRLLASMAPDGRVINLSSAAQAPVDLAALSGDSPLADGAAYAQSKLAITMWSRAMASDLGEAGPLVIAVNPGSLLGSKMVKEAFGVAGGDIGIGADILRRAALDDDFADASGLYFDNDAGRFGPPHADALDPEKTARVVAAVEAVVEKLTGRPR